jgi:hypothetical protein
MSMLERAACICHLYSFQAGNGVRGSDSYILGFFCKPRRGMLVLYKTLYQQTV